MLLAEEASPKLYCPLCKKVFSDPHITTCGVSTVVCVCVCVHKCYSIVHLWVIELHVQMCANLSTGMCDN